MLKNKRLVFNIPVKLSGENLLFLFIYESQEEISATSRKGERPGKTLFLGFFHIFQYSVLD